jgi:phage terminase large subunit-like protein
VNDDADAIEQELAEAAYAELATRRLAPRRLHALWDVVAPAGRGCPPGAWQLDLMQRIEAFVAAVERRESPRMMVFAPPQFGKSDIVSRLMPLWVAGKHPDWSMLLASCNNDLATRSARWVRNALQSPIVQDVFPGCLLRADTAAAGHMETTAGGIIRAISVGTGSGWPGRIVVVDDPFADRSQAMSEAEQKTVWDWYVSTVSNRLAPGGGILIMHTRWAQGDLAGRLLERAAEDPDADQWDVAVYPHCGWRTGDTSDMTDILHPERHGEAGIVRAKRIRATGGEMEWSSIHQQDPMPEGGAYFSLNHLQTYDVTSKPDIGECHVALDLALRVKQANDRSAGAGFSLNRANDLVFLPGVFAERLHPEEAIDKALDLCVQYKAGYLAVGRDHISGALDRYIQREIERRHILVSVYEVPEAGQDKTQKARGYQAMQRSGRVWWPEDGVWRSIVRPEHQHFPGGIHDDTIDLARNAMHLVDNIIVPAVRVEKTEWKAPARWAEVSKRLHGGHEDPRRDPANNIAGTPKKSGTLFGQRGRIMS